MSLKVTTFSSKGRATRIYGHKTKRIHHLQSDNQLNVFLLLEWDCRVKDIIENVELIDLEETIYSVENLRLDKFTDKERGERYQLHTNFLITIIREKNIQEKIAVSVKSTSELERKIVIEKMEVERRYWNGKDISFYVVTDKEINKQVINNIKWVRESIVDKTTIRDKEDLIDGLYYFMKNNKQKIINIVLELFDSNERLKEGTALFIFRYLIGTKQIKVNMKRSIDLNEKVVDIINF